MIASAGSLFLAGAFFSMGLISNERFAAEARPNS